ncbi:hypothetical protein H311_01455, partial [Anncaliia algerae PRA109]
YTNKFGIYLLYIGLKIVKIIPFLLNFFCPYDINLCKTFNIYINLHTPLNSFKKALKIAICTKISKCCLQVFLYKITNYYIQSKSIYFNFFSNKVKQLIGNPILGGHNY